MSFCETVTSSRLIREAAARQAEKYGQSDKLGNNMATIWSWDIRDGIIYGLQAYSIETLVARAARR